MSDEKNDGTPAMDEAASLLTGDDKVTPPEPTPEENLEVPPGFEPRRTSGYTGPTEVRYFDIKLASSEEIATCLGRNWPQISRLNQGKALVRFAAYLKDQAGDPEALLAVATMRYAISQDGRVSGPWAFVDESWPQRQDGHNSVIERLMAEAKKDEDSGEYFNNLMERAKVSPFASQQGSGTFLTLGGPLADDFKAFANKFSAYITREIGKLDVPRRRAPAARPPVKATS
jgi:hypothetical protein